MNQPVILAFSTKGTGSNEEERIRILLSKSNAEMLPFDRRNKRASFRGIMHAVKMRRPDLLVMEGTGIAGGLACILGSFRGTPFIFSSGDAVGPFIAAHHRLAGPFCHLYERMLYRRCAGFIGWTPYLVGRAMTFGTQYALSAQGFAPAPRSPEQLTAARARIRAESGIPENAMVFGMLGAIVWNHRVRYCYGFELVEAFLRVQRDDLHLLIVGDGSGLERLKERAGGHLGKKIHCPGSVPFSSVLDYMAAMDVGSLPQSVDRVGAFRYTTKISEYVAARLPVAITRIPMAYDLDSGWMWRLPGSAPWSEEFIDALANLMRVVTSDAVNTKRTAMPEGLADFDQNRQVERVTSFVADILASMRKTEASK